MGFVARSSLSFWSRFLDASKAFTKATSVRFVGEGGEAVIRSPGIDTGALPTSGNEIRVALYTCVTKGYETTIPRAPAFASIKDSFIFCDFKVPKSLGWTAMPLMSPLHVTRPDLINRHHKLFGYRSLSEYDVSIYVDGNILVYHDPIGLIHQFCESNSPIGLSTHPQRTNIIEEVAACLALEKINSREATLAVAQIQRYLECGYPAKTPLLYGGIIFRKHRCSTVVDIAMEKWWLELLNYTPRDQVSLPFILWAAKIGVHNLGINIQDNAFFYRFSHRKGLEMRKFLPKAFKHLITRHFRLG